MAGPLRLSGLDPRAARRYFPGPSGPGRLELRGFVFIFVFAGSTASGHVQVRVEVLATGAGAGLQRRARVLSSGSPGSTSDLMDPSVRVQPRSATRRVLPPELPVVSP